MTKFKNVEFLRFIFSLIIVHYHIYSSINIVAGASFYRTMAEAVRDGYVIVEMFFIMAGFFLGRTYQGESSPGWGRFALGKIIRFWPLAAFVWLFSIMVYQNPNIAYTAFLNLFFLQSTGMVVHYKLSGILWFVSALFWVLLFYYYLLKNFELKQTNLWMALIVFLSYTAIINHNQGNLDSAGGPVIGGVFNLGILRASAGVGLGYFLSGLYSILRIRNLASTRKSFILFSLIEAGCLLFILINTVFRHISYDDKFVFVPVFAWLLLSFCLRWGIVSRLLENDVSRKLGKYAYSVYVMQIIAFYICARFLWQSTTVTKYPLFNVVLTLAVALVCGIAGYHLIEVPAKEFFGRRLAKKKS